MPTTPFVPLTPEQHEREHLGLKTQRDGDTTTITVYARMLNATNAPALLSRIASELAAGVTDVRLDLSRCDRGLDDTGREAVRAIERAVRHGGGTFEVVWPALNPIEPLGRSRRDETMNGERLSRAVIRGLAVKPKIVEGDPPHLIAAFRLRGDMIRSGAERIGILERQNARLAADLEEARKELRELRLAAVSPSGRSTRQQT